MTVPSSAAAAPDETPRESLPAPFRWILALPVSPVWLGVAGAALYVAIGLAVTGADNRDWLTSHVAYMLYWIWLPLAVRAFVRGAERDLDDLRPALDPRDTARRTLEDEVLQAASRAIAAGLAVGLAVALLDLAMIFSVTRNDPSELHPVFVVVRELAVCLPVFAVLGWAFGAARGLSRITRQRGRVDLLDPDGFAALGRCGTRLALWWLLMIGITLVLLLAPGTDAEMVITILVLTAGFAAMAVLALVVPTAGGRHALTDAKAAELARVREEIRAARHERDDSRLPGLLAWEERVRSISVWPIDARSLRLTGLYVLIPVGSWVAGALVERVVDTLLG